MYLATSGRAISVVLLVDRDNVQTPIYYIIFTLIDAETSKLELSGQLAKWAIELGEYSIEYKPRPAIKGRVLAHFIAEVPSTREVECQRDLEPPIKQRKEQICQLYPNEAYNDEGSSTGLNLKVPEGHEFTYAIRLDFKSTNNEEEFEAFLAGLRIAKNFRAKYLEAHVDSMLLANHIEGAYEAKDDKMVSYLAQAKALMLIITTCKIKHIKRSENK
ncbi:uncharacterized protein LOC143608896 [Bidens hawaiensis]|uniref:uncharacterized protein LOC143608896 n=1 Tax=Bidens hawaiensis TaxID=980011 RepID=UPI00404AD0E5